MPAENLDALADAGLYGIATDVDIDTFCRIVETLAGACLTTAFVWAQHHGAVLGVAHSTTPGLADELLEPLRRGTRRAGLALGGLLPGPPVLVARPAPGGWLFSGGSPWVTGWGRIDVLSTAARTEEGSVVSALVDARAGESLAAGPPLELVAVRASATVRVAFRDHFVPAERVAAVYPYEEGATPVEVLRIHGALALGVAARCCRLLGPGPLDGGLTACRRALDEAGAATVAAARAAASELALRAASALVVSVGSGSLLPDEHAQRLAREALFLLVFGGRPAVKAALLERLGAAERLQ